MCYSLLPSPNRTMVNTLIILLKNPFILSPLLYLYFRGYFNIELFKVYKWSYLQWRHYFSYESYFFPTITFPTRINDQSCSLIDNIFITVPTDSLVNKVTYVRISVIMFRMFVLVRKWRNIINVINQWLGFRHILVNLIKQLNQPI